MILRYKKYSGLCVCDKIVFCGCIVLHIPTNFHILNSVQKPRFLRRYIHCAVNMFGGCPVCMYSWQGSCVHVHQICLFGCTPALTRKLMFVVCRVDPSLLGAQCAGGSLGESSGRGWARRLAGGGGEWDGTLRWSGPPCQWLMSSCWVNIVPGLWFQSWGWAGHRTT